MIINIQQLILKKNSNIEKINVKISDKSTGIKISSDYDNTINTDDN